MAKVIDSTNLGYLISKIKAAFWSKSDVVQIGLDDSPTSNSDNLVKSGGVYTALGNKQDVLVSGTNIKTINNTSLIGSGDITISGGGSGDTNVIENITFNGTSATIDSNTKTAAITAVIPSEVTENTVLGWGFTKNTGTLTAETDPVFTASTAASITSADVDAWNAKQDAISDLSTIRSGATAGATALQSYTETDPIFSASVAAGITSNDITNWNNKTSNVGTVTQVKVGTTEYNPSSGVVSLPAYPTTLPASDVPSWAKQSTKPSYTASEVGALPDTTTIPTTTSALTNDSGFKKITISSSEPTSSDGSDGDIWIVI